MDSRRLSSIIFRRMTDMHLLWVSGADIEVWKDSRSRVLQKLSTFPWSTSHDVKALSHLAETSTVGTASFANASVDRFYCKHDLSESWHRVYSTQKCVRCL